MPDDCTIGPSDHVGPQNDHGPTRGEALALVPAGSVMDKMIAEQVMGWKVAEPAAAMLRFVSMGNTLNPSNVPHYSTDVAAAWLVVDVMIDHWDFDLRHVVTYTANFTRFNSLADPGYSADGETAPLAICRAALLAVNP